MSNLTQLKKNPAKTLAIELLAFNPELSLQQIADKVGVSKSAIVKWKATPEFIDAVYDRYMMHFGLEVPQVLDSMVREAKAGNVQAGRLVLEHSGKLVKNINVTIDSPFEKFLKNQNMVDVEYETVEDPAKVERKLINGDKKVKIQKKRLKSVILETKKQKTNRNQNSRYQLRQRAKRVGLDTLPAGRLPDHVRKNWLKELAKKEKELGIAD